MTTAKNNSTNSPRKEIMWAISGLSFAGLVFSVLLTKHHFELKQGAAGFKSFCNINSVFNCDSVASSAFAEILPGLPLASFAGGWFLAMLIISLLSHLDDWKKNSISVLKYMSAWSLLCSVFYFFIMAAVIKAFCLYCLIVDVINVALFIVLFFAVKNNEKLNFNFNLFKKFGGVVATSVIVSVFLLKVTLSSPIDSSLINDVVVSLQSTASQTVQIDPSLPAIGASASEAKITVVEFSDFQCPHCRQNALILKTVLMRHPGKVRVIHRNYPLDAKCNKKMQSGGHPYACEAAKGTFCAQQQGKFEHYFETLFDRQAQIKEGFVVNLAQELGLNVEEFKKCLTSNEAEIAVQNDLAEGDRLQIQSTPTLFINGKKMEGAYPVEVWDSLVKKL